MAPYHTTEPYTVIGESGQSRTVTKPQNTRHVASLFAAELSIFRYQDGGAQAVEQTNVLGQALRRFRERAGKSIPAIADATGIDRMYLYRIERQEADWLHRPLEGGSPRQPSRDLIIRLGFALQLDIDDVDELLMLAGYAPLMPLPRTNRTAHAR